MGLETTGGNWRLKMPKAPDDQGGQWELSEGGPAALRRLQFIEPIASPKTLVVVGKRLSLEQKKAPRG